VLGAASGFGTMGAAGLGMMEGQEEVAGETSLASLGSQTPASIERRPSVVVVVVAAAQKKKKKMSPRLDLLGLQPEHLGVLERS